MLPDPVIMAEQILDLTRHHRPPTDVRAILAKWPRLGIVETDLDGDGFLVDLGEIGAEILVNKEKPETRKRFTLAHELGHFLLRHHLTDQIGEAEIERWCNKFGAELLLPRSMLSDHLKRGGLKSLTEQLIRGPKVFQVSATAFYMKVSRAFPVSIFDVLVSGSVIHLVRAFRSRLLDDELGGGDPLIDSEVENFLLQLSSTNSTGQRQLKKMDRICLARKIARQKFLVVFLAR